MTHYSITYIWPIDRNQTLYCMIQTDKTTSLNWLTRSDSLQFNWSISFYDHFASSFWMPTYLLTVSLVCVLLVLPISTITKLIFDDTFHLVTYSVFHSHSGDTHNLIWLLLCLSDCVCAATSSIPKGKLKTVPMNTFMFFVVVLYVLLHCFHINAWYYQTSSCFEVCYGVPILL